MADNRRVVYFILDMLYGYVDFYRMRLDGKGARRWVKVEVRLGIHSDKENMNDMNTYDVCDDVCKAREIVVVCTCGSCIT